MELSWLGDRINRHPKGEVGVLKEVKLPTTNHSIGVF
jgi:hypothetical protein